MHLQGEDGGHLPAGLCLWVAGAWEAMQGGRRVLFLCAGSQGWEQGDGCSHHQWIQQVQKEGTMYIEKGSFSLNLNIINITIKFN